jgi:osmotically-inducible protein OsmY
MPGRWSDESDWQGRDWRSRAYDREEEDRGYRSEDRSFDDAPRYEGSGRDRVFGERDTGAQYNERSPRTAYGGYRGDEGGYSGEGYRSGYRTDSRSDYRGGRPAWQDRDYQGVSPAMQQGEYDLERNRPSPRFSSQDYTRGGRFYGDDSRERIYREEYGQGGREYGREPSGYDAGYRAYGDNDRLESRYAREMTRQWSGGTGGYDYERGYGDAGRSEYRHRDDRPGTSRSEDFFRRAGERISSWFGGRDEDRDRRGWEAGHRGRGPKGYQRPDERISDEAHQRLTDDPWVDATNVNISVSGGELTLSGTVDSREAKHRAERCVEDISGVKHVQNNLRIEGGNFFTRPERGYGDSVAEAQMRGDGGASGGTTSSDDSAASRTTTRRT